MSVKLTSHFHFVQRLRMHGVNTSTLPYVIMSWCLIKHQRQLSPLNCKNISCIKLFFVSPCTGDEGRRNPEVRGTTGYFAVNFLVLLN
jgi:hypothetical protein